MDRTMTLGPFSPPKSAGRSWSYRVDSLAETECRTQKKRLQAYGATARTTPTTISQSSDEKK